MDNLNKIPIYLLIEINTEKQENSFEILECSIFESDCIKKLKEEFENTNCSYFEQKSIGNGNNVISTVNKNFMIQQLQVDVLLTESMRVAMVNVFKYIVTNEWGEYANKKTYMKWLSNGTGLDMHVLQEIIQDATLYDERYIAGKHGNPFESNLVKSNTRKSEKLR